jgi:lysophospholipase L1-like esterase
MFHEDYTHASWYARIDALKQHPEAPAITLFYALHFLWIKFSEKTGLIPYLPKHAPLDSWLDHGSEISSEAAFRANISRLIDEAKKRDEDLAIVTFATYLPKNYDFDKTHDQQPEGVNDYTQNGSSQIEAWGRARNVVSAIEKHNEVSRQLGGFASKVLKNIILVDLDATFPRRGEFFIDMTHLSDAGQQVFVNSVVPVIVEHISRNDKD